MADIKLFNIKGPVKEYQGGTVTLEKELQTVIENSVKTLFMSASEPPAKEAYSKQASERRRLWKNY